MYSIILLTLIIYNIYGETINRDTASTSAVIECSTWPCIINCNVAVSCYYGKISCPTTGSGDCTINIRADSAGERSTINTGTATNVEINLSGYESLWLANINSGDVNNFAVNVQDTNRALFNSEININSVAGDLSFMVNGNSYHAFYSMKLTISNWITGNAKFIENTDGNGINRNFGTADIQINGNIGGNLLFEAVIDNGNQAFDLSKCTVTGSVGGNVTMKSGTFGSFSESDYEVLGGVGGNILLLDTSTNGHGFCCGSNFNFLGDISGSVSVRDETPGSIGGRTAYNANFELGCVSGNVEFIESGGWGRSFKSTTYDIVSVGGNLLFESKVDFGIADKQAFDLSTFNIGSISGDLSFLSNTFGSFSECRITINGDIGGNVLAKDTSSHGRGFYNSFFNFYGNIGGNAQFIEESDFGVSFGTNEFNINTVNGNLLFQSVIDNGRQAFDVSRFTIGSVNGDLEFNSNTFASFSECNIIVSGDIGGNVLAKDIASGGHGFYNSNWEFLGIINGGAIFTEDNNLGKSFVSNVFDINTVKKNLLFESVIDNGRQAYDVSRFTIGNVDGDLEFNSNTFGSFSECIITVNGDIGGNVLAKDTSSLGRGFYNSFFNFYGNIGGNAQFIEESDFGVSFGTNEFDINTVNGNLLFSAMIDNGRQAFDVSRFTIGNVNGELSVLSNTFGAFSECIFNIDVVNIKSSFIGTASGGYDFFSADININNCPNILIEADGTHNIYDSHNRFGIANGNGGSGVGLVEIKINGGIHALHSTLFDAQYANELILKCNNDADCTDVEIKCPQDNKQNKCRIYCEPGANCQNIDLFTTNGYCLDASFNCIDSGGLIADNCQINYLSQVFCTVNTAYNYGQRGTQCQMKQDTNGLYCDDIGSAQCSTEAVCGGPTNQPTQRPTPSPTPSPTFEPCTNTIESYNIEFIIDESGSVQEDNYKRSIDFVIDLIRNDINANSKVAALSYATSNDIVYEFIETQTDERNAVIAALNDEKNDYAHQYTDTYNAIKGGIQLFKHDTSITDNKVIILITDGIPWCAGGDSECIEDICGSSDIVNVLKNEGIKVYIIGIGDFDSTKLNCLVNEQDMILMTDFSSQEFKRVETEFRQIFCPGQTPHAQQIVNIKNLPLTHLKDINENNNNILNYKWLFVNALMSVIATVFIILSCYICYYYIYKKSLNNGKYSKVVVVNDEPQSV